ncbi:MAG: HNH endonuclease [Bacilli bacterium]|nr:HNH endonuclease [Bacilli bacterium]
MLDTMLLDAVDTARLLGLFKTFCENNAGHESQRKIRNILSMSKNKQNTIIEIFRREQKIELNDVESERMLELVKAFLNKTSYRTPIDREVKERLLNEQKQKCAICNCEIDIRAHADHIVPFKYVGDCLEDNWQLLCEHCNEAKNDSLDYQIKYLLKLL